MKVILINASSNRGKMLGPFAHYVPLTIPMGVGFLYSYLNSKKIARCIEIYDDEASFLSEEKLAMIVQGIREEPLVVGISAMTASIARAYQIARSLKKANPLCYVVLGGIHPTILSEEALAYKEIDFVIRGEGEISFEELLRQIAGRKSFEHVTGLSYQRNGNIVHNAQGELIDLALIPHFPYDYFARLSPRYNLGFLSTSRGCPYDCIFCSNRIITGQRYRFQPLEQIEEGLEILVEKYHKRHITFVDDSFLTHRKRITALCEKIIQRYAGRISFDCQARADTVDKELLQLMRRAGFRLIHFGIETASERLMKLINKKETVHEVVEGIKLTKSLGFQVSGTFILGLPTETKSERQQAWKLANELKLDYVRFNNATPYPGTELYRIAQKYRNCFPGENWENLNACGSLVEMPGQSVPLAFVPDGVSEKELKRDIARFNLWFSANPLRVIKLLLARVGPAGWFELPPGWYRSRREWKMLFRFSVLILRSLFKTIL